MDRLDELKRQRMELERQIEEEERNRTIPMQELSEISTEEKVALFDKLYAEAKSYVEGYIAEGSVSVEDYPHYMFEAVVIGCLGKDIFKNLAKID